MIAFLDYGAGNVRSVINAIESLGEEIRIVQRGEDILSAERLVFPGVGAFGSMMNILNEKNYVEPLRAYLSSGRPFLGICLGLQALFEGSEEAPGVRGLGFIRGLVKRFDIDLSVPHIGWNGLNTTTDYGCEFVSSIQMGNIIATQFHPEKSGGSGLRILENFLESRGGKSIPVRPAQKTRLAKRIIACLDVRANDQGDLVVTKGDQYDVREKGLVRNLGKPVELARRYYQEGADEITFLNITGFRDFPLEDMPMLEVLRQTSKNVFVPLTIGGGIRDYQDKTGRQYRALEVASEYFRSGADKVSIGSDAVLIVEEYLKTHQKTGLSSIEEISRVYGSQAVVISIDPRRVYVGSANEIKHQVIETTIPGPNGEGYCWYQCTIRG
ncbi:MAG: imidazole glycerol phosphate synthase subunit HisH, partial [Deltaproteobacteria bacterium]